MEYLTIALALAFAVLVGRNDGSPLVALAIRAMDRHAWLPPLVLATATVTIPLLGWSAVADTLAGMFTTAAGSTASGLAVLLLATIITLLISTASGIPTSITLAIVGATAGAQFALGAFESGRIVRVLVLAAAGPLVALLIALVLTRIVTATRGRHLERTIRWQRSAGLLATAVAYGANDGQKLLAVFAVMFGVSAAGGARDWRIIALVFVCFVAGTVWGMRRSVRALRQGVLHPKPYQVASTLWASAAAVLIGSALAAPVSMTQSITGGLIGSTSPHEWRRVRWEQGQRVLIAWLWTLPVAAIGGWLLTILASAAAV